MGEFVESERNQRKKGVIKLANNRCAGRLVRRRELPLGVLYLHSRCHPGAPTWAVLSENQKVATVVCATCEKPVVELQLAGTQKLTARCESLGKEKREE